MRIQSKTGRMVLAGLLAALLVVMAQIVVPIGPVPFSMAVFGVVLMGLLQSPAWAAASLGAYMLLGVVGVPVFAGFKAGPQVLFGPTGGYLVGYFALALALAFAVKHTQKLVLRIAAGVLGLALLYLFGTLWYVVLTGASFASGLALCVLPFIIPDLAKLALGVGITAAVQRRLLARRA